MTTWVFVWLVLGLVSAVAIMACLAGLARHLLILSRTLKLFNDEVGPVARDIAAQGAQAADHAGNLQPPERHVQHRNP